MTATFNKAKNYEADHTRFGGYIDLEDFNTDYRENNIKGSPIAKRIAKEFKIDNKCRDNIMIRKNQIHN